MTTDKASAGNPPPNRLEQLLLEVTELRQQVVEKAERRLKPYRHLYPPGGFTKSAYNLAHYLALRQQDLRQLQDRLAQTGLSSLGRAEAYVLSTLDSVIAMLRRATDETSGENNISMAHDFIRGPQLLKQRALELFGPCFGSSEVHVMVTLPTAAGSDYGLVRGLIEKGMTCARINCAHDDQSTWRAMVGQVRRAEMETGRPCRILMDLAGHKIRTGPVAPGPPIRHLKVSRDPWGRVVTPGRILLTAGQPGQPREIPIPTSLHGQLQAGDRLSLIDCRGKERSLRVEKATTAGEWEATHERGIYLKSETEVLHWRAGENGEELQLGSHRLGVFQGAPLEIRLFTEDRLLITDNALPGRPAEIDADGTILKPAHISCTLAGVTAKLQAGHSVWIDDGKLGCEVEAVQANGVLLRVIHAPPKGVRLQSDKGINFPETELNLPPLSEKDLADLDFACRHSDLIGFSFVETLSDMETLMAELAARNASERPIVAKIETNRAVRNLPDIILGTIGRHCLGIMIARGDLAVELGSSRLAEIQEELLWLCEAGHVPVIWATQVLESIAKKGVRSRPEFTDAAMGVRAECVMLNKGPYILDAVEALINVLIRMQAHQRKKFSRLRALHW